MCDIFFDLIILLIVKLQFYIDLEDTALYIDALCCIRSTYMYVLSEFIITDCSLYTMHNL